MDFEFKVEQHTLTFKKPAKTSRNTFQEKTHWIIKLWDKADPNRVGIGEAAPLEFLSPDYKTDLQKDIEVLLEQIVNNESNEEVSFNHLPSAQFAIECALLDLKNGGNQTYFYSDYLIGKPIPINGLVWMNELSDMLNEAVTKVQEGFECIKFKVGSFDFDAECRLLEAFRNSKYCENVIIRLDANGAFLPDEALLKLKELKRFNIHSIEQPIKAGHWDAMAKICKDSKIPIALDEELIGVKKNQRKQLLREILPQYIILKPTLVGGFKEAEHWIEITQNLNIGWWATSALESNIGLNAIAQWVGTFNTKIHQGLGTGMLYQNNFVAQSFIRDGLLYYKPN